MPQHKYMHILYSANRLAMSAVVAALHNLLVCVHLVDTRSVLAHTYRLVGHSKQFDMSTAVTWNVYSTWSIQATAFIYRCLYRSPISV